MSKFTSHPLTTVLVTRVFSWFVMSHNFHSIYQYVKISSNPITLNFRTLCLQIFQLSKNWNRDLFIKLFNRKSFWRKKKFVMQICLPSLPRHYSMAEFRVRFTVQFEKKLLWISVAFTESFQKVSFVYNFSEVYCQFFQ